MRGQTLPQDSLPPSSPRQNGGHESLVVVMSGEQPTRAPSAHLLGDVTGVVVGRSDSGETVATTKGSELELRIADPRLSSTHFRIDRTERGFRLRDLESTNGTLLNGHTVTDGIVDDGDVVEAGRTLFLLRADETTSAQADIVRLDDARDALASFSPAMQAVLAAVPQLARSRVPVLVQGETGTGKELLARALHRLSGRAGAFVPINCAAIPVNLVESELFGHKKGAFSGALDDRKGLVEAANRGTLFLDEIGDLPLGPQGALLRVLQEREVTPVGATKPIAVDFRLVAATHRPLGEMVEAGTFREDLFARIAGSTLRIPPLAERREDIGLMVRAMLERLLGAEGAKGVSFASPAARALLFYSWPRNARELESTLESALALRGGATGRIEPKHLPAAVRDAQRSPSEEPWGPEDLELRRQLMALLKEHDGNVSAVARAMGKARMQIHRWMRRYGLKGGK